MTWLFGFLIIIPTPTDVARYVGFSLAFIFCVLNAFQGVFIFIWAVVLRKLQLKHLTKSKYKPDYSRDVTTESFSTNNRNYRNDTSTQNTYYNENSEIRHEKQDSFELNTINRNVKMNHYVNVDEKNSEKNRSNRDEYNRKSVKTLIRKNEDLSKEIDLSSVHLEYHQKKKKSYY